MTVTERHADQVKALCRLCQLFGERQWCLATSGNFSIRAGASHCLITQSGRDKTRLTATDLLLCDLDGLPSEAGLVPSAETALHTLLYRLDQRIAAVLHTHSVAATVMSRAADTEVEFSGFEMQKAIAGIVSHDDTVSLPVFENSQDMADLAAQVEHRAAPGVLAVPGFLVRGHGLYAWGNTLAQAARHVEGFEFLLSAALHERSFRP
jgi:methylthioribulose-1-phosphate dehydratase